MRVPAIAAAACLALVPSAHVPPAYAADDFMDACMLGSSPGSDMPRICTCMSEKVDAKIRSDAIEAMRRSYQSMADTSRPIDPATLPQNLMMGLQAVVLAQADCSSQLTR